MEQLPEELLIEILTHTPVEDLGRVCGVNREWERICRDDGLWKRLYERDFPSNASQRALYEDPTRTWLQKYLITREIEDVIDRLLDQYLEPPLNPNLVRREIQRELYSFLEGRKTYTPEELARLIDQIAILLSEEGDTSLWPYVIHELQPLVSSLLQ